MDRDTTRFFGTIPEHYDQGLGPVIFVDYAADMARRTAAGKPMRVLETAAGTGIVTRRLRDVLPAGAHLTATDFSPPMLEIARTRFRPDEQVVFQPADATALPFADESFDAVVCQFGLMFFPDKDKSYREVHRVLAPGGRYLFSVWDSHDYNPFARIGHAVVQSFFPVNPPQFYAVPFSCNAIDPIKEAVLAAGFEHFDATVLRLQKVFPDARAFARGMIYGNPVIDQMRARGGSVDPERAVDAVVAELHREFGPDPGRMPLQAILFTAGKST